MSEKQTNTWQQNMMGLTFRYADGRISIFKSALEAIGRPEFYHFLYNSAKQMFAIQACGIDEEGANRLPKHSTDDRYEIKSKGLCAPDLSKLWLGQDKVIQARESNIHSTGW